MARPPLTCFIAAPTFVDTAPLRKALSERGVNVSEWDPGTAILLSESIDRAISRSNFVCVVLTEGRQSPNVWLEAGFALAKRLPILVFAEPSIEAPIVADQWNWVRAPLTNSSARDLHLDAFLQQLRASNRQTLKKKKKGRRQSTNPARASAELKRIGSLPAQTRAIALEQLVANLFENAGLSIVKSPENHKHQVDLALWIDDVRPSFNPLYVELKLGDLSEAQLQEAESRLRSFISASHGGAGLLAYLDVKGREFTKQAEQGLPVIVWKSIPRLIEEIENGSFMKSIQSEGNRAAHL
jgi:hypothetical protein